MKLDGNVTLTVEEFVKLMAWVPGEEMVKFMGQSDEPDIVEELKEAVRAGDRLNTELTDRIAAQNLAIDSLQAEVERLKAEAKPKRRYDVPGIMARYDAGWDSQRIADDMIPIEWREEGERMIRRLIGRELKKREHLSDTSGTDD